MAPPPLTFTKEVRDAIAAARPVVALESTIISHGMPYPDNLRTARQVEEVVRRHGATPATIALVDGKPCVGIEDAGLERIARGSGVAKASIRDLAAVVASGGSAGTTVAATMRIAALAGIGILATGGIGGVHRGAENSFDISADLVALGTIPVGVVCAGAKSILDLPKTLEVLETQQVPVIGFGTNEFPAFFARESGLPLEHQCDDAAGAARIIQAHRALGLMSGVLIANPIPREAALPAEMIEARIAEACREAEAAGVSHKELTPFLLARINELTAGRSLAANIALILDNAAVAADIAVALRRLSPA
jgi:pseudouridylate synthase